MPVFDDAGIVHAVLRRRRSEGLERRLARLRRERQPAQRAFRRRRLQVHRRRQDLEARRPARSPSTSAQILIDPRNSNVVYVAAQGPLWSAGGERGLYKTTDGGATWTAVLDVSQDTGISDIVFDPKNPTSSTPRRISGGARSAR